MDNHDKELIEFVTEKLEDTQSEMKSDIKDIKKKLDNTINNTTKNTNDIAWLKRGLGFMVTVIVGSIGAFFGLRK